MSIVQVSIFAQEKNIVEAISHLDINYQPDLRQIVGLTLFEGQER